MIRDGLFRIAPLAKALAMCAVVGAAVLPQGCSIKDDDGDDVIEGGLGRDTLTGKGGKNQFVYRSGADGLDAITDFKPGQDTLVFTDLLKAVGITSADPLARSSITAAPAS